MSSFLKIAWRNIFRNKRRSLITISAVSFGLAALIFIWAFVDGVHRQMIENFTSLSTSHIQIHAQGFNQNPKLEMIVANPTELIQTLSKDATIEALSPRIKSAGLVSSAEGSAGVQIIGIAPTTERALSSLHKKISSGNYLSDNNEEILIGKTLARNFNVEAGDKIVVMSQAIDGSIASASYSIAGFFDTGTDEIDKNVVFITYAAAQELFMLPELASEIAVKLTNVDQAPVIAQALAARMPDLEVLPWQDVAPSFKQWIEFDNGFIWIIVFVVMIVVAIGILNTVLMGVLERTREFGVLTALGTTRREIMAMVAWESILLGTIGSVLGVCLGVLLSSYFAMVGINLTLFSEALNSLYIDAIAYPMTTIDHVLSSAVLVMLTSFVVSIYPAWHAASLKPMDAIRSM